MQHTLLIAEAGVNHNGSVELAHKLIDVAHDAGADIVKFQTWTTDLVMRQDTPLVEYQKATDADTMYELVKGLELSRQDFAALKSHCDEIGIEFMSTAFDLPSLDYLIDELGTKRIKIPSGDAVNVPLLRQAASKALPTIVSTGMCTMDEVELAVSTLRETGTDQVPDLTVLHCTTAYPTPEDEVHLRSMTTIKNHFDVPVGLSDHTEGHMAAVAAVAMGAVVIEKHFTLDRSMQGPDHQASVDPSGLIQLVNAVRSIEKMHGSSEKKVREVERETVKAVRRALVATRDIPEGEVIEPSDLVALRPEDGIPAREIDNVVGKPAWKAFRRHEVLKWPE